MTVLAASGLVWLAVSSPVRGQVLSDHDQTNADSSTPTPYPSATNAAPAPFLQNHPALQIPAVPPGGNPLPEPPPIANPLTDRFLSPEGNPEALAQHLLVVYNTKDPDSKSLAEYYASRREIAPDHVLGIACPTAEEITRKQYEDTVREPIISYIYRQNWMERRSAPALINNGTINLLVAVRNEVWAMVLMRGVPLRIANDPNLHGSMEETAPLQTNAAAVDSELALLPMFGFPPGGLVPNLFFDVSNRGLVRTGPELATKIILVTRLDGPTPDDVRRMIDDSLYAEENRLAGLAVVDTRGLRDPGNAYTPGDDRLRSAEHLLEKAGWSTEFDEQPDVLPASDPCNHVALYLGWYHEGAIGPWVTPPNRFVRGAVAYHLHSFSATTVRSATAGWVGPLIAHGAAATMGCVYEPYLDFTPHLDIFTKRLLDGDYFSEAAYASERGLSWMVTVVGDPLYRPFRQSIDAAVAGDDESRSDHYGFLLLQQTQLALNSGEIPNTVSSLVHELDIPCAAAQEGLGDLLAKRPGAAAQKATVHAYGEAQTLDQTPIDQIRVGLELAHYWQSRGRPDEARNIFATLRAVHPKEAVAFAVPGPPMIPQPGSSSPEAAAPPAELMDLPKPAGPPQPPKP